MDKPEILSDKEIIRISQETALKILGEQIPAEHISTVLVKQLLEDQRDADAEYYEALITAQRELAVKEERERRLQNAAQ